MEVKGLGGQEMVRILFAALLIITPSILWADPGDVLYVQGNSVNVRSDASTSASVIMKLNKGHKLIEFERRDGWIHVGIDRTGGKDGWIFGELVGLEVSDGKSVAPADQKFTKFRNAVFALNEQVRQKAGINFFTEVENLGDGIVRVTATKTWIEAPYPDRQSNLNTLFELWNAAEGSGLPIMVQVVDQNGNVIMKKARR